MRKTDKEIKDWIDSKEALTPNELTHFMYPNWNKKTIHKKLEKKGRFIVEWWDYVLRTKDWHKLRAYKELKIKLGQFDSEKFGKFKTIYHSDERARTFGRRRLQKLLKRNFNLALSQSTIERYKKLCIQENN